MLIEDSIGYLFSFDEYAEDFMLLSDWELKEVANEYNEKFIKKLLAEKTISNYENIVFTEEDLKKIEPMKTETFLNFVKDCEFERSIIFYSSEEMIEALKENNPYKMKDFAYRTVSLTTIKNEYVNESYSSTKYKGKLEELPLGHPAYKLLDDIKKNPFFADEAYKEDIKLIADGESWYVALKYTDPDRANKVSLVQAEDVQYLLDKYKDIDYSKVRNKDKKIKKEEKVEEITFRNKSVKAPEEAPKKKESEVADKEIKKEKEDDIGPVHKPEKEAEQESPSKKISEEENEKEEKQDDYDLDLD